MWIVTNMKSYWKHCSLELLHLIKCVLTYKIFLSTIIRKWLPILSETYNQKMKKLNPDNNVIWAILSEDPCTPIFIKIVRLVSEINEDFYTSNSLYIGQFDVNYFLERSQQVLSFHPFFIFVSTALQLTSNYSFIT